MSILYAFSQSKKLLHHYVLLLLPSPLLQVSRTIAPTSLQRSRMPVEAAVMVAMLDGDRQCDGEGDRLSSYTITSQQQQTIQTFGWLAYLLNLDKRERGGNMQHRCQAGFDPGTMQLQCRRTVHLDTVQPLAGIIPMQSFSTGFNFETMQSMCVLLSVLSPPAWCSLPVEKRCSFQS